MKSDAATNFASIRARLESADGQEPWRSLEEAAGSAEFAEILHREFPEGAAHWDDPVGRRHFLQLMGASIALAGVTGCTKQPKETIWPYAQPPEEIVPGTPVQFATALPLAGYAVGVLAESHAGRPTKIEGNPDHPASLGGTDVFAQAAILGLYDPDRSQAVTYLGNIRTWAEFITQAQAVIEGLRATGGEGLRFLTGTVTSPTLGAQLGQALEAFPKARWHQWEAAARDQMRAGSLLAFGVDVDTRYRLDACNVIVSFDDDFMGPRPGSARYIREFASRRNPSASPGSNRLYVVECTPTITGASADHRLPARASQIEDIARGVAAALGLKGGSAAPLPPSRQAWVEAVARDLQANAGSSAVLVGDGQPAAVHAIAHAINELLGNVGRTVFHVQPIAAAPTQQAESLAALADDMNAGHVSAIVVLSVNPVYDAPADLKFGEAFAKVALRIHLGLHQDETAALSHWHIPEAHALESWTDTRAFDGTASIVQPLIEPLYDGKTAHEVLGIYLGQSARKSYDAVREHWKTARAIPGDFEDFWRKSLKDGVVRGTEAAPADAVFRGMPEVAPPPRDEALEVVFRVDPNVYDGRFANNGWLQELPRPLTKLTWGNAAIVSPKDAERLGLSDGDVVELSRTGRAVEAPVLILPGQAEGAVTVHLGFGRSRAGRVGDGVGFNAYLLRGSDALWFERGVALRKTGANVELARTQSHHSMEGRHLVRRGTLAEYRKAPDFAQHVGHAPAADMTLYPAHAYPGHAWGMSIDLNACVGCNACVIACQAENNIPVVGKEQVLVGRAMHWIRVDRYFEGGLDEPEIHHQPVPCMHCENAPCEVVCPVGATVHSSEGLNDMVYNRCVGTRYCSNNCPYKVRRFNFLLYQDWNTPTLKLARNPDVTVRSRGVMEKCTYCVQRINEARNHAKLQDRPIADGEIVTACQQACPAQAITFGDQNDAGSLVSRTKADPRNYSILADLNTRPRTTYLASLRNPNPELAARDAGSPATPHASVEPEHS